MAAPGVNNEVVKKLSCGGLYQQQLRGGESEKNSSSSTDLSAEGLFRKSGNVSRVRELESLLASGSLVPHHLASSRFSPHDVAATLKAALARLSEPLLTRRYAGLFGEAARLTQPRGVEFAPGDLDLLRAKQLKALRLLFLLLPDTNRRLLGALLSLLAQVSPVGDIFWHSMHI